jgi:hypothetical protein
VDRAYWLALLGEAYDRRAWHGPNLRGAIRRVDATSAAWRPGPGRHGIADITVHCAYWKYAVRRRIRGDKRGSFALPGSNWFTIPQRLTDSQWRDYVKLLDAEHATLLEAVATAPQAVLEAVPPGKTKNLIAHIYAIAFHDVYHAGQIQTLKGLLKSRRESGILGNWKLVTSAPRQLRARRRTCAENRRSRRGPRPRPR